MEKTKARRMRELLEKGIVVSPGVFDGYSARLVEKMGFQACSSTGAGLANSRMSQPDVGIMTLTRSGIRAGQRVGNRADSQNMNSKSRRLQPTLACDSFSDQLRLL